MALPQEIADYYFDHFTELDSDKQFHFASRLHGWNRDLRAKQLLESMWPIYVGSPDEIRRDLKQLMDKPPEAKINALEQRQPYFDAYPELRGYIFALFRVRHLRDVYGIDARDELLSVVERNDLDRLADMLTRDHAAIRTLSTYAINYLYLLRQILFESTDALSDFLTSIKQIAAEYDRSDSTDVQLLLYLYTHCIIGASNFYLQPVPPHQKHIYVDMVKELEPLIAQVFDRINLDNKFEYLVCCRILGYETPLFERIYEEAARSLSPHGTFVIDTINTNRQNSKTSLNDSEHRNVLFIMSSTVYHSVTGVEQG